MFSYKISVSNRLDPPYISCFVSDLVSGLISICSTVSQLPFCISLFSDKIKHFIMADQSWYTLEITVSLPSRVKFVVDPKDIQ